MLLSCITSHNHKEDIYKSHNKSNGLALQLVARAMSVFFAWAVVRLDK